MLQPWVKCPKVVLHPVKGLSVFTDAGKRSKKAACVWKNEQGGWNTHVIQGQANDTLQTLELVAVVWALGRWAAEPINVISDSQYVVGVVQRIDEALIRTPKK